MGMFAKVKSASLNYILLKGTEGEKQRHQHDLQWGF